MTDYIPQSLVKIHRYDAYDALSYIIENLFGALGIFSREIFELISLA